MEYICGARTHECQKYLIPLNAETVCYFRQNSTFTDQSIKFYFRLWWILQHFDKYLVISIFQLLCDKPRHNLNIIQSVLCTCNHLHTQTCPYNCISLQLIHKVKSPT